MSQRKNKQHRPPMRRCIGCMESRPQAEMVRIVWQDGELIPDPDRKMKGRGVYLCPRESCCENVLRRRGFNRALRQNIPAETAERAVDAVRRSMKGGGADAEAE